jgi:hypothetical protein
MFAFVDSEDPSRVSISGYDDPAFPCERLLCGPAISHMLQTDRRQGGANEALRGLVVKDAGGNWSRSHRASDHERAYEDGSVLPSERFDRVTMYRGDALAAGGRHRDAESLSEESQCDVAVTTQQPHATEEGWNGRADDRGSEVKSSNNEAGQGFAESPRFMS